jgi:hypothetical protein
MEQQITNSDFRAWFQVSRAIERDEGYSIEVADGRWILNGVVSLPSFAAAQELMA